MANIFEYCYYNEMKKPLPDTDKALLWQLDFKSRVPLATLAQNLRVSKAQVHRRMQRLRALEILRGFSCVLDVARFGYTTYRIYFRFGSTSAAQERRIFDYFTSHPFTLWVVRLLGRWDMEIVFVVRNAVHLNTLFKRAQRDLGDFFEDYNISISTLTHHYRRDYLMGDTRRSTVQTYFGKEPSLVDLDRIDYEILEALIEDSKRPSRVIGKSLGVNYHTVQRRIEKMEESGIIQCYRPVIDIGKLGRRFLKVLFKISAMPQKLESELFQFLTAHSFVVYLTEVLGDWQLEVECEVADTTQVFEMILAARRRFGRYLQTSDVVEVATELKLCYLPTGIANSVKGRGREVHKS